MMTANNSYPREIRALQRLRTWHQMEALIRELEELFYQWRDLDYDLDDVFQQRLSDAKINQLNLPNVDTSSPMVYEPLCPLCIARRWP